MTERVEQRYCIKFCQKLGDSKAETIRKIQQAFDDVLMKGVRSLFSSFTETGIWLKLLATAVIKFNENSHSDIRFVCGVRLMDCAISMVVPEGRGSA
jgi:hypothetical protein